jgi:hypothetical protein
MIGFNFVENMCFSYGRYFIFWFKVTIDMDLARYVAYIPSDKRPQEKQHLLDQKDKRKSSSYPKLGP